MKQLAGNIIRRLFPFAPADVSLIASATSRADMAVTAYDTGTAGFNIAVGSKAKIVKFTS